MKLLQRFRKQTSRQDAETQAAQELEAAMAAKPAGIPAMAPAPGLPGDGLNGSASAGAGGDETGDTGETGETGEMPGAPATAEKGGNGETLGSVTDLPKRRPAATRKTGVRKPTSTKTAAAAAGANAGARSGSTTAKPTGVGKTAVRKPAAKKTPATSTGGTVKKRAPAAGAAGRPSASRQPAAKKR